MYILHIKNSRTDQEIIDNIVIYKSMKQNYIRFIVLLKNA